ncbi:MAG: lipocalin family protein [Kiritimatiellia bacterium]
MTAMLVLSVLLLLSGCLGIPKGVQPVQDFAVAGYLGTWYEIVRLDHRFERGLSRVSAQYSLREDGTLRVVNRGYLGEKGIWKSIEGRGRFVSSRDTGYLKVSFFGPFYSSYVIFELEPMYQYAFVTSATKDYLWLLARTPSVEQAVIDKFVARSKELGFATEDLIFN